MKNKQENVRLKRREFFKDKNNLFFVFFFEIISLYFHFIYINETYFFMIPVFMFGFLGMMELWFLSEKVKE